LFVEKILNYEHIYQNLLTPLTETKLISELKEISTNFTSKRDKIGEYVVSKEMVSAYTCFYLPTNIPKFHFLMSQLPEKIRQRIGELDFLDVGTGPGTYLVAYDQYFGNEKRLYGLDTSSLMLEQAKKLLGDRVVLSSALPIDFSGGVLLFGNSLN
jgi:SAM-dependent methyltransferase